MTTTYQSALIVGAGAGISASVARAFAKAGLKVALAGRSPEKVGALAKEIGATTYACDASDREQVEKMFAALEAGDGAPDVVVYNASYRTRGALVDLDPVEVEKTLRGAAFAGFLVGQAAVRRMLPRGYGAVLFTGASASIKGYPQSAPFAMGKFALRGLAQSMARELGPQGIHVAHFVIDGVVRGARYSVPADKPDSLLDPDAIAQTYLHVLQQPRSTWTWEIELRPWTEKF